MTPYQPEIELVEDKWRTCCNTCGTEDNTVKVLSLRWSDRVNTKGGNAVALCSYCRHLTCNVLAMEHTL